MNLGPVEVILEPLIALISLDKPILKGQESLYPLIRELKVPTSRAKGLIQQIGKA